MSGWSGAETLRAFRGGGGRIRSQTFYTLWRATQESVNYGSRLKFLSPTSRPDPSRLPLAIGSQLRQFSFRVEVRGHEPRATGDPGYFVTVSSSSLLTRGEIESFARSLLERQYRDKQAGDYTYRLTFGQRAS